MRRTAWPVLVCLVVAASLFVTAGVLDETVLDGERMRVAFLPPWESAAGLILASAVGLGLVVHFARRQAGRGAAAARCTRRAVAGIDRFGAAPSVPARSFPTPFRCCRCSPDPSAGSCGWWWSASRSAPGGSITHPRGHGRRDTQGPGRRHRRRDRGRVRRGSVRTHRDGALPVGRRAALPRDRPEPVARRRPEIENNHVGATTRSTSASPWIRITSRAGGRRDLLDPSGGPAGAARARVRCRRLPRRGRRPDCDGRRRRCPCVALGGDGDGSGLAATFGGQSWRYRRRTCSTRLPFIQRLQPASRP